MEIVDSMIPPSGAFARDLQQAALLIDADNFSDAQAIDAAWAQLKSRAGRVSVCRAYGSPARLQALAAVWRSLGARAIPNLALDKNTTDAALIADAVALHFQQGVRIFAIASGDADFAPLTVRLREWGCEVWCFSMEGILFAGAEGYYDRVVRFSPQASVTPVVVPVVPVAAAKHEKLPASASASALPVPVPVPVPVPAPPARPPSITPAVLVPAPVVVAAPPKSIKPPPPLPALPEEVERILKAVPGLRDTPQMLNQMVPVLRQKSILGKTTKSTAFFARHAAYFKLSPAHQPTQLAYTPPRSTLQAPAHKTAQPVKPVQHVPERSAVSTSAAVVLSWPVVVRRQAAPPLLAELHGLRSVLLRLAARRVSAADVLLAAPEMLRGQSCALSAVAGRLREKGLLRPYLSALRVLERHPRSFAVEMNAKPPTVIYLR